MSAEVAQVLRDAAELIEPPGRWTQRAYARCHDGEPVAPFSPSAVCWCVEGAIKRSSGGGHLAKAASFAFCRYIHLEVSTGWNDDQPGPGPVIAALRAAADEAEQV